LQMVLLREWLMHNFKICNFSLFDINNHGYHQLPINFIAFRGKIANKNVFFYPNFRLIHIKCFSKK
jgi:hypothetical protein